MKYEEIRFLFKICHIDAFIRSNFVEITEEETVTR